MRPASLHAGIYEHMQQVEMSWQTSLGAVHSEPDIMLHQMGSAPLIAVCKVCIQKD